VKKEDIIDAVKWKRGRVRNGWRVKWVDGKMVVYLCVLYSGPFIPLGADGW